MLSVLDKSNRAPRAIRRCGMPLRDTDPSMVENLTGFQASQLHGDNALITRTMALFAASTESNRSIDLADPTLGLEQPEPSLWATPECKALREEYDLQEIKRDQGPLGHQKTKPVLGQIAHQGPTRASHGLILHSASAEGNTGETAGIAHEEERVRDSTVARWPLMPGAYPM